VSINGIQPVSFPVFFQPASTATNQGPPAIGRTAPVQNASAAPQVATIAADAAVAVSAAAAARALSANLLDKIV
jgi:hypothetical protein